MWNIFKRKKKDRRRCKFVSLQDCFANILAFGVTGSGKTTFMANLALDILEHPSRPGMMWCCVKDSEVEHAAKLVKMAGREEDAVIFGADSGHYMDIAQCELSREGGSPESLAQSLDRKSAIATRNTGSGDEKSWAQQAITLIRNCIELIRVSGMAWPPSARAIHDVVATAPMTYKQASSEEWRTKTACGKALDHAIKRANSGQLSAEDVDLVSQLQSYLMSILPGFGDRYCGSIMGTGLSGLTPWISPPFSKVFASGKTNIRPDCVFDGTILIADFSVLKYGVNGAVAQSAIKEQIQQACLQRPPGVDRPVFIFSDEAHFLVSPEWDAKILTVCRSHKLGHIDMVQSMPAMESAFSAGDRAEKESAMFVSAHGTLLLGANNDAATNKYFSELLGTGRTKLFNFSRQPNPNATAWDQLFGNAEQTSFSMNENLFPNIPPEFFGTLRRGGAPHWCVDMLLFQAGRVFDNGKIYKQVTLPQVLT